MPITSKFVCLNGRFLKEEEVTFNLKNRAFRYGDGFFETMHYANGEVQLFSLHQKRMKRTMDLLKLESNILLNPLLIHKEIIHLINANHYFKGARIRITIYRDGYGLYTPETNQTNYLIETWALDQANYPINKQGLTINVYSEIKKASNNNTFYKSLDSRVSVLASLNKKEHNLDENLICNTENEIIESISSNVFFVKNNSIYTSSQISGCVNGIMREKLIEIIPHLGFELIEDAHIKIEHISQFDEIFLSNAIQGIQWVGAYNTKRFDNKTAKLIHKKLITSIFNNS